MLDLRSIEGPITSGECSSFLSAKSKLPFAPMTISASFAIDAYPEVR
jgi:hypothetical protein